MRRLILLTLTASLLAGCGVSPAASTGLARAAAKKPAAAASVAKPLVTTIPGYKGAAPTVSVTAAAVKQPATAVAAAQNATAGLIAADSGMDSIELASLIQDGAAFYHLQGWFGDLTDYVKRTWTRWKLSRAVKAALKKAEDNAFDLHEGEIDAIKKNRTAPITSIKDLGDGMKEVVQVWKSTNDGNFEIEVRRQIDEDGVTQVLSVASHGRTKKNEGLDTLRIRTLTGEDGTYKVATKQTKTFSDARVEKQEWLKVVLADGSETITGAIDHPDGARTEITGTRDPNGKVKMDVAKIKPGDDPK